MHPTEEVKELLQFPAVRQWRSEMAEQAERDRVANRPQELTAFAKVRKEAEKTAVMHDKKVADAITAEQMAWKAYEAACAHTQRVRYEKSCAMKTLEREEQRLRQALLDSAPRELTNLAAELTDVLAAIRENSVSYAQQSNWLSGTTRTVNNSEAINARMATILEILREFEDKYLCSPVKDVAAVVDEVWKKVGGRDASTAFDFTPAA